MNNLLKQGSGQHLMMFNPSKALKSPPKRPRCAKRGQDAKIIVQAKLMPWFNGKRIQMGTCARHGCWAGNLAVVLPRFASAFQVLNVPSNYSLRWMYQKVKHISLQDSPLRRWSGQMEPRSFTGMSWAVKQCDQHTLHFKPATTVVLISLQLIVIEKMACSNEGQSRVLLGTGVLTGMPHSQVVVETPKETTCRYCPGQRSSEKDRSWGTIEAPFEAPLGHNSQATGSHKWSDGKLSAVFDTDRLSLMSLGKLWLALSFPWLNSQHCITALAKWLPVLLESSSNQWIFRVRTSWHEGAKESTVRLILGRSVTLMCLIIMFEFNWIHKSMCCCVYGCLGSKTW